MSNAGQAALSIVGGVVGFFVGGPSGAYYGFQLGYLAGTAFFPTQLAGVTGPRLQDVRTTTAQVGAPVQEVFGTDSVAGTVIYTGPVIEVANTETVGGKGAPEQDVTTFKYYQTIAVGLCRGPKDSLLQIFENGKLMYDLGPQKAGESEQGFADRIAASETYGQTFNLYNGDEEQLPDPTLEAEVGIGQVPAYRGLMYLVYPERELKQDQGLRHPNFKFVVSDGTAEAARRLVAVASSGSLGFQAMYSDDGGDTWTLAATPGLDLEWQTVIHDPVHNRYIAGGTHNAEKIMTSTNGVVWSLSTPNTAEVGDIDCLDVNPNTGRVVGVGGDNTVAVSDDGGLTWSPRTAAVSGTWRGVTYVDDLDLWVAMSDNNLNKRCMTSSDDGDTWVERTLPATQSGATRYIAWNGAFLACSGLSEVVEAIRSVNGVTWTEDVKTGAGSGSRNIASDYLSGGASFLEIYQPGDGIGTSNNGAAFTQRTTPTNNWRGLCWSRQWTRWVMTASTGGGIGGDKATWSLNGVEWTVGATPSAADGGSWSAVCSGVVGEDDVAEVSIAEIITAICARVKPDLAIDVSDLADVFVHGYTISRVMNARDAIEPLRMVGYFDIVESGSTLRFPRRGAPAIRTLTENELGVHEYGSDPPAGVGTRKLQDVTLPRQVRLHYRDPARDFEEGEQLSPSRLTTLAVNDLDLEVPIAISAQMAAEAAEVNWSSAWAGRWPQEFVLGLEHFDLEPGDNVIVPVDDRLERVRINAIDGPPNMRRIEGVRDDADGYVSIAIVEPPARPPGELTIYSASELLLLDLPALRDSDDDAGLYALAWPENSDHTWSGARVFHSADGGVTFVDELAITGAGTAGTLAQALGSSDWHTWDDATEIIVDLESGSFESRTDEAVLAGANALAIGAHGRWEVVQFATAQQLTATQWRLTRLLRGRRGTEHLIGLAVEGDRVALLSDGVLVRLPLANAQIGLEQVYKVVTINTAIATGTDQTITGAGVALEPFSPVFVEGTRNGSDDLEITWLRRNRLGQELQSGVEIPMSEASLAFEVDIIEPGSPDSVVRTLSSSTETVTYTAAQQTTDFGAPQPSITVRVYQLSAVVGRGTPAEATL